LGIDRAVFRRVLIANRGEIALRVIRACRELGIETVAVFGDGDEDALHVRSADDAYRLPADGATLPYLNIPAIVEIAKRAGAEAVHPGYGFLAENAGFAEACAEAGLVFVGPSPAAIKAMGDKVEARRIAIAAGTPVTPGSNGAVSGPDEIRVWAEAHGYPIAVKASAGGGGRGFRVARNAAEVGDAFTGSSGEAARYFGDPSVYVERYFPKPRHIEIQVFGDAFGTVVALGERDCSVQRRHQKLIEETPSPALTEATRQALFAASVALAKRVDYCGAGTIEYLLDQDGKFYFLEMNTRIQVEHTVTEEVTGIDLVQEQLSVAAGNPLSFSQESIAPRGHAIQVRLNAEDPGADFKPGPGPIAKLRFPDGFGIRVDAAMEEGLSISPRYDSMIAKLVVWGRDRPAAIARMRRALADTVVEGVPTTIPFHKLVMAEPDFIADGATTAYLPEHPGVIPPPQTVQPTEEMEPVERRDILVEVNDRRFRVTVPGDLGGGIAVAPKNGVVAGVRKPTSRDKHARHADQAELSSPLQGVVVRVAVENGQRVARGDLIAVVEAMKMENEITAHRDGVVSGLAVAAGDTVKIGAHLVSINA
jgi:acetyl-CoA/propionyl-CoA carboxylase biotin carboxyl carrier protein